MSLLRKLSPRQRQVWRLTAQGHDTKKVAQKLGIAERTVEVHKTMLWLKIGAKNSVHAAYLAFKEQVVRFKPSTRNHRLTYVEMQAIEAIAKGGKISEVAGAMNVSYSAAATYLTYAERKLRVHSTQALIRAAFRTGVLKV